MWGRKMTNNWVECKLEDCVDILDSLRIPINNTDRQTRIKGKSHNELYPYYGATGQVGVIDDYIFEEELVALGEDGAPFLEQSKPKAYMLRGKTWVNNHAHVLRANRNLTSNKFLLYYLNQFNYQGYVNGGTRLKLTQGNMRKIPIFLPALAEQTRIAEKLDELLAQVDTLKARIDRIPAILKRFRQSVLAAAVSGRLTEEWRLNNKTEPIDTLLKNIEEERIRLKKQKQLKQSFGKLQPVESLYLLPDKSWQWVCFDQISRNENNALKAGPFGSSLKKSDCIESGYKVYGQEQVIAGDEELSTYFISDKKFKDLEACAVIPGDILISLVGTIGKVLLLSEKAQAGIINPRLVKLGLNKEINRRYIKAYLDSSYAHGFFKQFSHGGTMEILNLGILKQLPIPLPPVEEQAEIVRRVEQLFAYADQLEAAVNNARARIDRLTQSILAKAFRGELVPQDPNDEPASVLLERIRTERTAQTKPRRNQRKTAD